MTDCWPGCTYDCCLNRGGGVTYPGQGAVSSTGEMVWLLKKAEPVARAEDARTLREKRQRNPRDPAARSAANRRYYLKQKLKGAT